MVLQMIAASWCTSCTIINCCHHVGFLAQAAKTLDSDNEVRDGDGSPSDEVAATWATLQESGNMPADVHPEYIQADLCLVVHEETDEQILKSVREDLRQTKMKQPHNAYYIIGHGRIRYNQALHQVPRWR